MLLTAKLDMAKIITPDDVNVFLDKAAWAICSTYHTVIKAFPGAAIFGQDMLFDILFRKTGTKLEITGNISPILIWHAKIPSKLIMIKKLTIRL
jgi:hypothetical protein